VRRAIVRHCASRARPSAGVSIWQIRPGLPSWYEIVPTSSIMDDHPIDDHDDRRFCPMRASRGVQPPCSGHTPHRARGERTGGRTIWYPIVSFD